MNEATDVVVDPPALADGGDDGREVFVGQQHVGRLSGYRAAGHAHGTCLHPPGSGGDPRPNVLLNHGPSVVVPHPHTGCPRRAKGSADAHG